MCSFTCLAADNTVEIYCEKGTILLNYGDVPSTVVPHPKNGLKWFYEGDADWTYSDIPSPVSHGERISGQSAALAGFLCGRRGPVATAAEGRDVLRMVLACYVANGQGRRVSLDDKKIFEII
jgi:predicted dehydrogenase